MLHRENVARDGILQAGTGEVRGAAARAGSAYRQESQSRRAGFGQRPAPAERAHLAHDAERRREDGEADLPDDHERLHDGQPGGAGERNAQGGRRRRVPHSAFPATRLETGREASGHRLRSWRPGAADAARLPLSLVLSRVLLGQAVVGRPGLHPWQGTRRTRRAYVCCK